MNQINERNTNKAYNTVKDLTTDELTTKYTKHELWDLYEAMVSIGEPRRNSVNKDYVARLCKDAQYAIDRAKRLNNI